MKDAKQAFLHSLDLVDQTIEPFVPTLLADLWELGSIYRYVQRLISQHICSSNLGHITDLGCGKGAILIQLAESFCFQGLGIDLVPAFIAQARHMAWERNLTHCLEFQVADMQQCIPIIRDQDVVIYGMDSDLLGDVKATLQTLNPCLKEGGWLVLELAFTGAGKKKVAGMPTEAQVVQSIAQSDFSLINRIDWDLERIKTINRQNTQAIEDRITQLIEQYPEKKELFNQYLAHQRAECKQLEEELICSTLLLHKSPAVQ